MDVAKAVNMEFLGTTQIRIASFAFNVKFVAKAFKRIKNHVVA